MVRNLEVFLMLNCQVFSEKLDAEKFDICFKMRCWIGRKKDADLKERDARLLEKGAGQKMLNW